MAKVSLRVYNREIEAMIDRGQLDEAIAHSQHILKTFPKHLETYRLLGKAYLEYKRFNEAVDIFSRVLAAEPSDFVSNVGMSIIRDEQGKMDDAIWHMERAFETQPSNPAIQGELQRLYGRRDGVRPPRIRMTRGALAHMYVQGELYPQAISEIKSVLKEDPGRSDMSVLLARAYYRSGQKNQAADEAAAVLRRYPYCLEANRVLVEIAGAESAQAYRQRVIELDPYAAQVTGTIFQTDEVGDNAVVVEHLEWDGEPVAPVPSDWGETKTSAAEGGFGPSLGEPSTAQAEPDWLKMGFADSGVTPPSQQTVVPPVSESPTQFDFGAPGEPAQPTPEEEIPDFLRAAGWGKSSGTFDESKSAFADEPVPSSTPAESIEQGDLPDWVKAMAPQETAEPTPPAAEGDLPDWIKNIGTGALSSAAMKSSEDQMDWLKESEDATPAGSVSVPTSSEEPDWLKGAAETSQPESSEEQFDWLKDIGQPSGAPESPGSDETRMWLQGLEQREAAQPTPEEEQPDWMKDQDQAGETVQPAASEDSLDWLKGIEQPEETAQAPEEDETRIWLKGLDRPESTRPAPADEGPDWLKGLDQGAQAQPAAADDSLDWLKGIEQPEETATTPGTDETMSWLKDLDQPEPAQKSPTEEAPDWLKGFDQPAETTPASASDETMAWLKGLDQPEPAQPTPVEGQPDWLQDLEQPKEPAQASGSDDTLAWLQDLERSESTGPTPIEQGLEWKQPSGEPTTEASATADEFDWLEGVGTEPEPASESPSMEQPDWLTQFGRETVEGPATEPPAAESEPIPSVEYEEPPTKPHIPAVDISSLGKSEQEQDDSFAWLEALAAKQGASEGLLTKPEERMEEEPEWVKQAKGITQPSAPISAEQPAAKAEEPGKSQQDIDDSLAWLEGLAAKQGATEGLLTKPEERREEEPEWVKQARSVSQPPTPVEQPPAKAEEPGKSQQEIDDSLAWLEGLAARQGATEGLLTRPEERRDEEPDWVKQAKSATPPPMPPAETPPAPAEPAPVADLEDLGKSEQERDDSFAWLEALAAKQGASEGLLTKPEERLEEEPEWVRQARSTTPIPSASAAELEDLGKSAQEREDSLAWLDDVTVEQEPPQNRVEQQPESIQAPEPAPQPPAEPEPVVEPPAASADETPVWLRDLEKEELESEPAKDETAMWLAALDATPEPEPARQPEPADDLPSWLSDLDEQAPAADVTPPAETATTWLKNLEEAESAPESTPVTRSETDVPAWLEGIEEEEKAIPAATGEFDWLDQVEEQPVASEPSEAKAEEDLPAWLRGVDEETHLPTTGALRSLPGWMQDETGEVMAEPTKIEPTRATDWSPAQEQPPAPPVPEPVAPEQPISEPQAEPVAERPPVEEPPKPKPSPRKTRPLEMPAEAVPARSAGSLTPAADPILGSARSELSRSNIPGALQSYEKLIKKGRFLEEVIYDLRDALYRYPVEVSIWQSLGDAYMRANRLQDALDAFTKAEELLR